jgi:hypothetical protein
MKKRKTTLARKPKSPITYLTRIFISYRKYRNHKRFVRPELL